jgi:hypothetical protein
MSLKSIDWAEALQLLTEAAEEITEAGDPVPASLVKAYHMANDLAEKADDGKKET